MALTTNHVSRTAPSVGSSFGEKKNGWKILPFMQNNNNNNNNSNNNKTTTTLIPITKTRMSTRSSNPNLLKTPQRSRKIRGESTATPNKRRKLSSAKKTTKKSIFQSSESSDNALAFSLLSSQGIASRPHVRASKLKC